MGGHGHGGPSRLIEDVYIRAWSVVERWVIGVTTRVSWAAVALQACAVLLGYAVVSVPAGGLTVSGQFSVCHWAGRAWHAVLFHWQVHELNNLEALPGVGLDLNHLGTRLEIHRNKTTLRNKTF